LTGPAQGAATTGQAVRLLTLTGPGGVGKTRLALRVASDLASSFADEVVFVPLAPVDGPDLVLPMIARSCQVREVGDWPLLDSVSTALSGRRLLLVLDNFEHVVAAAPVVTELLARCPELHILVTSRVTLRVQGEQEYPVPPLGLPARGPGRTWSVPPPTELAGFDAITLFVQRARAVQPDFALTDANTLAVVEICHRLDGLPLAIELAAARVNVLSPQALLARLANRLQLLKGGARDQPARLQTMRSAIAWSFDLLDPDEQALFWRLSVCAGGFTLDAAEAIVGDTDGDVLDGLAALVDSSLVRRDDWVGGEPRFVMLETIREYGLEQLALSGGEQVARDRHAAWCLTLAEQAAPELTGPHQTRWLDRLETEHDNFQAALRWLLERGDGERALRIATSVWLYWFFRTHFAHAREVLEQALALDAVVSSVVRADALVVAAFFAEHMGAYERAHELLDDGLALARSAGYDYGVAQAIVVRADVVMEQGDEARAAQLYAEAVDHLRAVGDRLWLGVALAHLGRLIYFQDDRRRGVALVEEALAICRECGFAWGIALALSVRGFSLLDQGAYARAGDAYRECLAIWLLLGDRWRVVRMLVQLAVVAAGGGLPEQAARLFGAGEALLETFGVATMRTMQVGRDDAVAATRARLGADVFAAAWAAGRALTLDQAVAEALALVIPEAPIGSVVARDTPGTPARLSPRELEVLRLLVAGHTDRQIADALFISHRTAQGHVAGIFNKLGVNSRTAAATAAIRDGLVSADSAT
jgi:predicted ATPase/DNA-binding CsgD family transcriptional regulator